MDPRESARASGAAAGRRTAAEGRVDATSFLAIGLLAFGLRAFYVWRAWPDPAVQLPLIDADAYHARALEILAGDWLGDAVYYLDPLYPFFLAAVYTIVPPGSLGVLLVQAALDSLSVLVVVWIAGRVFDGRTALIAGLLAATYKVFFYYDALLLKAPLMIFLMVAALALVVRAAERARPGAWLPAGFVLGLAALTRGNSLLFAPALGLWILVRGGGSRASRAASLATLGLGVALAIGPVTLRNWVVGHDLVLLNSQAGQNFYIGHFRGNRTGTYVAPPFLRPNPEVEEEDFANEAKRILGRDDLRPSEISRFWLRRGLEEIAADPAGFLRHTARKALVFANHYEVPDNASYEYFALHVSPLLRWPLPTFGVVLPFALCGMVLAARRRMAEPLLLFFFTYAAGLLLFFNLSRMRLPVVPVAILFAAWALVRLVDAAVDLRNGLGSERDRRRLVACLVALGPLLVLTHLDLERFDDLKGRYYNLGAGFMRQSLAAWREGETFRARGEDAAAQAAFARAFELRTRAEEQYRLGLERDPGYARARTALAGSMAERVGLLESVGLDEPALAAAQRLVATFETWPGAWVRLGRSYERLGRRDLARGAYQRALQLAPGQAEARDALERLRRGATPTPAPTPAPGTRPAVPERSPRPPER